MRYVIVAVCFTALSAPVHALSKCVDKNGAVTFTDGACRGGIAGQSYTPPPDAYSGGSGLRSGEEAMLDRIREKENGRLNRKQEGRDFERRHQLTFSDRKRLRELEMKKRELQRSLDRGNKKWSQDWGIKSQIEGINRQIEQIREPKY